jgi:hypothetical protein
MDASSDLFTQHHPLAVGVLPDPANEVVSIHGGRPESSQSFGPCANGAATPRLRIDHFPSRSRLSHLDRTDRSPSGASRDRHVCGRPRKSLGRPVTRGFVGRFTANEHLALTAGRWVHGWMTVVRDRGRAYRPRPSRGPRREWRGKNLVGAGAVP